MLNLLRRFFFGLKRNADENSAITRLPEASPPNFIDFTSSGVTEHPPFTLSGAKEFQAGIAECRIGTVLQVERNRSGDFQFRIVGGAVVGKITSRHSMAKTMAEPTVVLHASINSISGTVDQSGFLPSPSVRIVTGPEGTTWSPLPQDQKRSYPAQVVGESFYQCELKKCRVGEIIRLFHEPANPYDEKAIAVVSARDETIGYLPQDSWLRRPLLSERKEYSAEIESIRFAGDFLGVVISVRLEGEVIGTRPFTQI